MAKRDRDLTKGYPRAQFVAKLRRLADSIESKKAFTIQVAGERFRIPADATFDIEHERSGKDEELEFQLLEERVGEERVAIRTPELQPARKAIIGSTRLARRAGR